MHAVTLSLRSFGAQSPRFDGALALDFDVAAPFKRIAALNAFITLRVTCMVSGNPCDSMRLARFTVSPQRS